MQFKDANPGAISRARIGEQSWGNSLRILPLTALTVALSSPDRTVLLSKPLAATTSKCAPALGAL